MLPDGSINPGDMTSFNHYAFGAVADWLHRTVAGPRPGRAGLPAAADRARARAGPHLRRGDARDAVRDGGGLLDASTGRRSRSRSPCRRTRRPRCRCPTAARRSRSARAGTPSPAPFRAEPVEKPVFESGRKATCHRPEGHLDEVCADARTSARRPSTGGFPRRTVMRRIPFNGGWETRPNANFFAEMIGAAAPWQPVTLPHDAALGARPRRLARRRGPATSRAASTSTGRRSPSPRSTATSGCCWSSRASTARRWST